MRAEPQHRGHRRGRRRRRPSERPRPPSTETPSRSSSTSCRRSTGAASAARRRSTSTCRSFNRRSCPLRSMPDSAHRSTAVRSSGATTSTTAGATYPARTIEAVHGTATTAIYTNSLTNTRLQSLLSVDQSLHWADPLGTTRQEQLRERATARGGMHPTLRRPDPRRRAPPRRRGPVAVRRSPRGVVHARSLAARARVRDQHVQLRQHPGGDHALVPRSLARRRSRERLRRSGRHVLHPRRRATRAPPTTRSRCRRARRRPSSSWPTSSSTPTASSTSPTPIRRAA